MGKSKEIVKLCFKKLKNGEKSAYFDIYRNGVREYLWQEERLVPGLDEVTKEMYLFAMPTATPASNCSQEQNTF